jgi:hypothetical protein
MLDWFVLYFKQLIMVLSRQELTEAELSKLSKEDAKKKTDIQERCLDALKQAEEYGLIKKS